MRDDRLGVPRKVERDPAQRAAVGDLSLRRPNDTQYFQRGSQVYVVRQ